MKHHYLSAKKLSIWVRLSRKWNKLYSKVQETTNLKSLKKLNNLSLLLGVKRKIALTALAGAVSLGVQAQSPFELITGSEKYFKKAIDVGRNATPTFVDLDSDGDLDFVVGEHEGDLNYFLNTDGIYTEQTDSNNPFDSIKVSNNSVPTFIDLDDDGDQDLVLGSAYSGLLYYTNEENTFTEQPDSANPFSSIELYSLAPVFIDLDEDGDQDLVLGTFNSGVKYYTNEENSFTEQVDSLNPFSAITGYFTKLAFTDVDLDGDLDFVAGEHYGSISYYSNENNEFTPQTGANNPFENIPNLLSAAGTFQDIDGDEYPELVLGEDFGNIKVYSLQEQADSTELFIANTDSLNPFGGIEIISFSTLQFADVDLDGDQDLAIGEEYGTIQYFLNNENSFSKAPDSLNPFSGLDFGNYSNITFEDIDADNDIDIIIGSASGPTISYFTNTDQSYTEEIGFNNPFSSNFSTSTGYLTSPSFIDADNDGDLDLVVGSYNDSLSYYKNIEGEYIQQTGSDNPFTDLGLQGPHPTFEDLDNDGDHDLIVGEKNGTLHYYTNDNFVFTEQTDEDNPFNGINVGGYASPAFVDIDNDGDLDLFIGNENGEIIEYRNDGSINGLFTSHKQEELSVFPNPATTYINTEEGQLEILDLTGNSVLNIESTGKVDVSNLESGIYIVNQNNKKTKLIIE